MVVISWEQEVKICLSVQFQKEKKSLEKKSLINWGGGKKTIAVIMHLKNDAINFLLTASHFGKI